MGSILPSLFRRSFTARGIVALNLPIDAVDAVIAVIRSLFVQTHAVGSEHWS